MIFLQKHHFFKISKYETFFECPYLQKEAPEQAKQTEKNKMSGNGMLTSLCGFLRKFLFSVDLN